jgi:hypothetical protein
MKLSPTDRTQIEAAREAIKVLVEGLNQVSTGMIGNLRFDAKVLIGEPHVKQVTQTACPWTCLAMVLNEFGEERGKRLEKVLRTVAAMTQDERQDEREDLKEYTQEIMERMGFTTEKVVLGQKRVRDLGVEIDLETEVLS